MDELLLMQVPRLNHEWMDGKTDQTGDAES